MPKTHRIALLEDNAKQLQKLAFYLINIPHVQVVLESRSSDDSFEQLKPLHQIS